jgi:hypothetical protein
VVPISASGTKTHVKAMIHFLAFSKNIKEASCHCDEHCYSEFGRITEVSTVCSMNKFL